jgi:lipopolysaccharide/colanic/teichoic acid biosynthesis glycosyltransferase
VYGFWKRFIDIALSLFLFVLSIPVCIFAAIGIYVSSRGPVLYRSDRAGLNGKPFRFYKFRSMHPADGNVRDWFVADPDRLFPFGSFIRRTKIDEIPQLLNILKGDMSFVGPRPMEVKSVAEIYKGKYEVLLSVKPGLTSIASLFDYTHGDRVRDNEEYIREILSVKLELELTGLKKRSVSYDLRMIVKTAVTVIMTLFGKKDFAYPPEYSEIRNVLL